LFVAVARKGLDISRLVVASQFSGKAGGFSNSNPPPVSRGSVPIRRCDAQAGTALVLSCRLITSADFRSFMT